jgi:hypothetical protein
LVRQRKVRSAVADFQACTHCEQGHK